MAAIVVIFTLGGVFLPLGGSLMLAIAAIPLAILCVRFNVKTAAISATASVLIILLLSGVSGAICAVFQVVPLGLTVGWMLKKRKKAFSAFLAASIASTIGIVLLCLFNMMLMGLSVEQFLNTLFLPFDDIIQVYEDAGMLSMLESSGLSTNEFKQLYESMINFCILLFPAMILAMGVFSAAINYFITLKVLKRLHIKVRKFPRFDKWYLPAYHAYGLVFALACFIWRDNLPKWLDVLACNLLFIYMAVLFIVGLAVVAKWFNFRKQSKGTKVLWFFCLFLVLSSTFGLYVIVTLAVLGAFDMLVDFRHIHPDDQLLPKFMRKNNPTDKGNSANDKNSKQN